MNDNDLLKTSSEKREKALAILAELELMARWGRFGRPVLVGAVSYGLVMDADIDMEIYCENLRIADGFQVLGECAASCRRITNADFENHLYDPDSALYWKLNYRDDNGLLWKIDMWSAPSDYPLPRSETIVEPMKRALTDETRAAILRLKHARATNDTLKCFSIDLYRAVLDDGVRDEAGFARWLNEHTTGELTGWMPKN